MESSAYWEMASSSSRGGLRKKKCSSKKKKCLVIHVNGVFAILGESVLLAQARATVLEWAEDGGWNEVVVHARAAAGIETACQHDARLSGV